MKLYDLELSGNCYKARLLLNFLGQAHDLVPVDIMGGEHKQPAHLARNPKGQIPVLVDGDVTISDSQAILVYLAEKAGATQWYPQDAATRAHIQYWLSTAASEIARGPADARLVKLFGMDLDYDRALATSTQVLTLLNNHLATNTWLVGDQATIADLAVFPYVALSGDAHIDLNAYPDIQAWIDRVKALPGFTAMPGI